MVADVVFAVSWVVSVDLEGSSVVDFEDPVDAGADWSGYSVASVAVLCEVSCEYVE